jgi:hypothetical protein
VPGVFGGDGGAGMVLLFAVGLEVGIG